MRVLLDECVDWRLSREIRDHEVRTARQMGWAGIDNGRLLALASEQFDVFVTVDQHLGYQQNLSRLPLAVILLRARSNRLADVVPLIPDLLTAIESAQDGSMIVVGTETL